MSIDIKNLSSSELFELAKVKEREEQEANQRLARLADVKVQKASLNAKHEEALAAIDKSIRELQEKRTQLLAEHKAALATIELNLQELELEINADLNKAAPLTINISPQSTPAPMSLPPGTLNEPVRQAVQPPQSAPAPRTAPAPQSIPAPRTAPAPQSIPAPRPAPTPQPGTESVSSEASDSSDELLTKIRNIMHSRSYISESLLKEKLKANGFDTSNLKQDMEKLIREGKLEKKGPGNYALGKKK